MKNKLLFIPLLSSFFISFAQVQQMDSVTTNHLKDVVITGQFEPQSIKKSVFNVTKITRKDIENQAANNLADVLNQYLNITISQDDQSGSGRSTVKMFGLDGKYFKILVDNVPLAGENGLGNDIDLTQVNLNDIEQIEIIEGSMGVTHGANAVSGILNIITKKSSEHTWEIATTVQEETVGEEYAIFNKGKHIQSLKISNSITDYWFASLGFNRNDFAGYLDDRKGKDYTGTDLKRGYQWLPKLQYATNGMLSYKKGDFRAFYKFDYLNENLDYYAPNINIIANPPFAPVRITKDNRYLAHRFYHHLNASGKLFQLNYNVSVSQQKQSRRIEKFDYNLDTHEESNLQDNKNQSVEVLYSTGTLSNFFTDKKVDLQLGYEAVNNKGFAVVDGENNTKNAIEKRFENYDFFVSSEIKATEKFYLRPGIRFSFQSQFSNQYASSLGLRYLLENGLELRTSYGKSFRVPTFEELYSKIKFSGHQFYGNENLVPETSTSYDFSIKRADYSKAGVKLANQISVSYIDIHDKIDMALVGYEADTTPIWQYINISSYKNWKLDTNNQFDYKNWLIKAGISLLGVSQVIDYGVAVSDDKFLYNLQMNTSVSYNLSKYNTQFSLYYKFNGKNRQFTLVNDAFEISEMDSYSFLDASVRKSFLKNRCNVTVGARNILDVTNIQQSLATGGAHTATSDILLGYGRSYFVKLTYNLNF